MVRDPPRRGAWFFHYRHTEGSGTGPPIGDLCFPTRIIRKALNNTMANMPTNPYNESSDENRDDRRLEVSIYSGGILRMLTISLRRYDIKYDTR